MEIGFVPVSPPQAIRPAGEVRSFARKPADQQITAEIRRENGPSRPEPPRAGSGSQNASVTAAQRAGQSDFFRPRVQPDLPLQTRRALETFVRNSFSEIDDPATNLGGVDVFV